MADARLARPWIHAFEPLSREAAWWTPALRSYSDQLFRAPIAAHPVLVRGPRRLETASICMKMEDLMGSEVLQTMHRLPDMGIPQVCMLGRSNVGKPGPLERPRKHAKDDDNEITML